mmetsp:Transcript_6981/g.19251  ORF Transcript_6981/g.19251 Transcript_6981/m.19251 type:complete len:383 (-) Transcript_6981:861-2009(-)
MNTSVIIRMQAQVCARKMKLAHHHRSSSIVLGTQELLIQVIRQGLASLPMLSKSKQSALVVAPVLHKLTWQFNRIPFNASNSSNKPLFLLSKHVLKCMSKFMKQSFDLSEGHEGWGISNWWRLVANHVCHRKTDIRSWSCKHFASSNHFIHPCSSTLFLGPGVWVVVKVRLCLSILGDLEESHIFVPYWSQTISCFNLNAKQLVDQLEHAFHHLRERKVWSKNLIIDIELSFAHSFRPETDIPMLEFFLKPILLCESFDFFHILLCRFIRSHSQFLEKLLCLIQVGHLCGKRHFSVARVSEKLSHLLSELKDPINDSSVIDVARGRPTEVGLVSFLSQSPVLGVEHDWKVRRDVEREHPRSILGRRLLVPFGDGGLRRKSER